ncbi:MAG: UDP-N-acetylglucosamine 4,6-dehydratase (inverting) [Candidatus Yanofskybacteria bacterium RIFCSPHIGHO2_02_FULL_41_29]|uniref:UDP-N-acetylglucosamine 4,6-dehydratase (Inverting) n=1 Tax=Candidatus Yanofskybacteria bacterium RIFCSPHIGHO2_01_FULL_41_53 TaxID=1802663 RepID=A0A1F8EJ61_9BACT|nr:MAG: UDP-N-acetylglucosamine 4,6-dehydratase (inverting) [Candidatus Yanofskybacteria bacterium RIFCSPHIGHO2_01_FULL_41_53]OGN10259.1 MAG: UDP-N-acetylglucosamine 4,6-dehydratase (inverting) [Candidatus Yanofskybacteria bacterium RIFCSPHIGHO2_02_FULL_41_29]OGN30437.1 MAG: UDP-N-acetylglucosamine 4,6-dehydratase (inverting) [Candidatus Yanofskybacteria bacterium RIFCSPLOWO2_02_FULL_41_13]
MLDNKTILITGGTGSFGKNFAKFLLKSSGLKKLIIFSRDEFKQYEMQKEISDPRIRFFIGDVRDLPRLQRAFHGVDIVIHAAALKQVPTLEYNPFEAVKTNIIGSQNVIDASIDQSVSKTLLISSDKAVQPINLYGATKLAAEKLFVAANSYTSLTKRSIFSAVRYGNVMGSRGSIVEALLKKPAAEKVFITHPDMTRFWLTLSESFHLVLFAIKHMGGGEIIVPKIPSMKITELFDALAPRAKKVITGIRPGEKIHETLLTEHEARNTILVGNHFVILPEFTSKPKFFEHYYTLGSKLDNHTPFASDNNTVWLTKKELKSKIKPTLL